MSNTTDIILTTVVDDGNYLIGGKRNVDKLNGYLFDVYGKILEPVQMYAGGGKPMLCDVFIGAFNKFDARMFYIQFLEMNWEEPDYTQLMMKVEHENNFSTYYPAGHGPLQNK